MQTQWPQQDWPPAQPPVQPISPPPPSRRGLGRKQVAVGVVVAFVALMAIGSVSGSHSTAPSPTPQDTVAAVLPLASAPLVVAPDIDTALPTPTPYSAPAYVAPAPNASWLAFIVRASSYADGLAEKVTAVETDIDLMDIAGAGSDLRSLEAWIDGNVTWMDDHKPTACYRDLWLATHHGMTDMRDGAARVAQYLEAFPYGSQSTFDAGLALMRRASAEINDATAMIDSTRLACGS